MNVPANFWLEQAGLVPGVFACAVRGVDQSIQVKSCDARFPAAQVEALTRTISDTLRSLYGHGFAPERVRWTFGQAQIHCITHHDNTLSVLIMNPAFDGSPDLERLLSEFQ